jgi:hypothetical protein
MFITVDLLNPKQDEIVVNKGNGISHAETQILFLIGSF